jgi:hypothetical protein
MRLNSDRSIQQALDAHDRFGSWEAVRAAARPREDRQIEEAHDRFRAASERRAPRQD